MPGSFGTREGIKSSLITKGAVLESTSSSVLEESDMLKNVEYRGWWELRVCRNFLA